MPSLLNTNVRGGICNKLDEILCYRRDRSDGGQGGVIYAKKMLDS